MEVIKELPTWNNGELARNRSDARFPLQWPDVGHWGPCFGETGLIFKSVDRKGHDGALTNMSIGTAWARSDGVMSLRLVGASNNYVLMPAPLIPAVDHTLLAWVRLDSLTTYHDVFHQYAPGQSGRFVLYVNITSGTLEYFINGSVVTSTGALTAGAWYHVAVTRTGNAITFYINGKVAGTGSNGTAIYQGINTKLGGDLDPMTGNMDNPKIYSYGLGEREIFNEFALGRGMSSARRSVRTIMPVEGGAPPPSNLPVFHNHYVSQGIV